MAINPNTRYSVWIDKLETLNMQVYKKLIDTTSINLSIMTLFNIINLIIFFISYYYTGVNIIDIILIISKIIFTYSFFKYYMYKITNKYSSDYIDNIIYGDEYAITEVNLELILKLIDDLHITLGRLEVVNVLHIAIQVILAILLIFANIL